MAYREKLLPRPQVVQDKGRVFGAEEGRRLMPIDLRSPAAVATIRVAGEQGTRLPANVVASDDS